MACWSFEPLIGFPLETVCNSELFALHSISPLEPDDGRRHDISWRAWWTRLELYIRWTRLELCILCIRARWTNSVGMPGAVVACWSFEPLISFPLCGCELARPMGGGTTFPGELGGLSFKLCIL